MPSSARNILLIAALLVSCLAGCVSTRAEKPAPDNAASIIPFTLTAQNNLVVDARINDSETLRLMLHTASTDVSLTEETIRRLSSVAFDGSATIQSWGGSADARHSVGNRVGIGGLSRENVTIWENKQSGDGTDGKFGLDHFGARVVEIDYDASRIVVHDALPSKAEGYEALDLENVDGDFFVRGTCFFAGDERTNKFLIHSGYAGGLLLDDAFAASSGIDGKIAIVDTSKLTDSYGNVIEVKKGAMPAFALGRERLSDVPVGFFKGQVGRQTMSVLGSDVLKRFNLMFDLPRNKLYVKRRAIGSATGPARSTDGARNDHFTSTSSISNANVPTG